jgi:CBS domain-containing protein
MVSDVEVLPADASIAEAVSVLQSGRHQTYPVIDLRGRPIGMVTRAEALTWAYDGADAGERVCDRVSDAAMPVVHPDDIAARAIEVMLATGQGRLAVTDSKTGVLKGLVTRKDLLKVRASVARTEGERAAYFGPSGKPAPG